MTDFPIFLAGAPVIVCGNPRSGTRMHANVLNAHPEILITDECHAIGSMRDLLDGFRRDILLQKLPEPAALERQAFLARMMWLANSGPRVLRGNLGARILGNKTPKAELRFEALEEIFRAAPPRYVYCLRSAEKVLRSVKNLPNLRWSRDTVEKNLKRYVRSVRCMEEMRARFPARVHVSVIDQLRPGMRNSDFFAGMFAFVGAAPDAATRAAIDALGPQNTMAAVRSATRQAGAAVDLTAEETQLIAASPDYREIRRRYALDPA
jgi:hypothetical protein